MFNRETEGRTAKAELSLYDAMVAEIFADKEIRAEKFRKTHDLRKKSKDLTPADRKRNKKIRMQKMYGLHAFEDTKLGKTVYYWDEKGGRKKFPEYESDIVRNLKDAEILKYSYAEMLGESERRIGWNAAERLMYNADKKMREIRAEYAEKGYNCYDDYYERGNEYSGRFYAYPDEYYNEQATWKFYAYAIGKNGMEYANKYAKGVI